MQVRADRHHRWDVTPEEAKAIQNRLRRQVIVTGPDSPPRTIAGVDVSFPKKSSPTPIARAAIVLLSFPDLVPLAQTVVDVPVTFPYIPGLLAFREGPAILAALEELDETPDLMIFDGHGLAHPRRMGIATHMGLLLDLPAIGCAKSRLCGYYEEPGPERGDRSPLLEGEEVIGMVVRSRTGVSPIFVSIGHRVSLESAVEIVLRCCTKYRLPEPTRLAHQAAAGVQVVPSAHQPGLF